CPRLRRLCIDRAATRRCCRRQAAHLARPARPPHASSRHARPTTYDERRRRYPRARGRAAWGAASTPRQRPGRTTETRLGLCPTLVEAIANTSGVAAYFDLSFQHASGPVLRRMRRFGDRERFLTLLEEIRKLSPAAGCRSNVIVGFPGETDDDVAELEAFLVAARLDAVGVFGYSDEEGTEAADLPDKLPDDVIESRVQHLTDLVEELTAQRAEE